MTPPAGHLQLRSLRPADQPVVRQLLLDGLQERWGELDPTLNRDLDDIAGTYADGVTLTAWRGEVLVGTGTLVPRGQGVAEVVRMGTARAHRQQGVATALLRELLHQAGRWGSQSVVLETSASWTNARAFYERNGFTLQSEEDGPTGRDAFYRLSLDGEGRTS